MKQKKAEQKLAVRLKDFDEMIGRLKSAGKNILAYKRPGSLQRH